MNRFGNRYKSDYTSHNYIPFYKQPILWKVILSLCFAQMIFGAWTMTLILSCVIGLALWAFLTPQGKEFLRKYRKSQQAAKLAESKIASMSEGAIKRSNFQLLMNEFTQLSTFSGVADWDERANNELQNLIEELQTLDSEINRHSKILNVRTIEVYNEKYMKPIEKMAEKLQESIDFTPNSSIEQKLLLKELRQHKKELQLEKREFAVSAKEIREKARIKSIHAGRVLGIIYDSKLAARERRSIRYRREAEVAPHENMKAAIERQILQIDKDIFWVERFTD